MQTRFPVVATLLCATAAAAAGSEAIAQAPPSAPDWSVSLGGGALLLPAYPGAASSRLLAVPFVDVRYRQLLFLSPLMGFGINAIATPRLRAGVSVLPNFGRSASSADRLRGWGDVSAGADLKVFAMYSLGPIALLADVRRQLGAGNGTLIDAGVTRTLYLSRHLIFYPAVTVTWANGLYSRAYFGIDEGQSAQALGWGWRLPIYSPGAGLRDVAVALLAVVPLDDRWSVQSFMKAELLLGDAAASPLTERRIQPTVGGIVAYRL